eukprot:722799_1
MCLVEYDQHRIFEEKNIKFNPDLEFMIPQIQQEICSAPTPAPTIDPTYVPTREPTGNPTAFPTEIPSNNPSSDPTNNPTNYPTRDPTELPTYYPTNNPTYDPTNNPSDYPTVFPTNNPTNDPTNNPTPFPTIDPTPWPTGSPTNTPTNNPTVTPTLDPTNNPTGFPTEDPTSYPTKEPTINPTTSPTSAACILDNEFEFAIIVDNSCGLNYQECLIQRDQIAELLSMLKTDNIIDNPKITYIEYNAIGANVRVSLDHPYQANTRNFYNFIRNHAVCGDGGDGNTDLLSGLQLALNEFELHGNPNAIKKIVTINNCVSQQLNT